MTDLREKIVGCLRAWTEDTIEDIDAHGEVCCAESAEDLADRILALLPKMPELRWDGTKLRSGEVCLGKVGYSRYVSEWGLYDMMGRSLGWMATEPEARAAVEAAVRKALGWVE